MDHSDGGGDGGDEDDGGDDSNSCSLMCLGSVQLKMFMRGYIVVLEVGNLATTT